MHGRKLEQLKQAMSTILSDLNQADLFSIVLFSNEVQVMTVQCLFIEATLEYVTFIAL
jgi:secreted protein with Ig-like and vWFA domain